ncbi:MAG: hypothetical protein ISR57_01430 [Bacteroidales bacterium]|nr:hypothetical protein [Bacteroidota bacterium]MBL6949282.1 hypothetical protein [Bacteroidales bacterium]
MPPGKKINFKDKRFFPGDSSELRLRLKYSRENIINTRLFLTVNVTLEQIQDNDYKVLIGVTERHYWWIFPIVKLEGPNFNEFIRDPKWSDLSMGLFFSHNNLWGRSHQASVVAYAGKSYSFGLGYYIPWIGSGEKVGLLTGARYTNLYTVEYGSLENKKQNLFDYNSLQEVKLTAALKLRPGLYNYSTIKLTGVYTQISDSLFQLDSTFLAGKSKENISLGLYVDFYYDSRNNRSYPLEGALLKVFVEKKGLGILTRELDLFYYGVDLHFYQKISERIYTAEMVKAVNSTGENYPYYYQQNLTENKNFIRGYDLYTIRGDQMYYFRSNIKYEIVKPSIRKAKKGGKKNKFKNLQYAFYLNIFGDAGYVTNKFTVDNPLNNRMLYSVGVGLDFVTYYDMVIRFEYAFTSVPSNGFFFGFGMPI